LNIYYSTPMKKILSKVILLFLTVSGLSAQSLPNVVFIMSDDIGPGDIGLYHRERTGEKEVIPTPNLDRLAAEGMRFDDAHTPAALCAPTRYSVITGNYTYRCHKPWGVWGAFQPSAVQPGQMTVAEVMKNAGYHTAFFGKWHLGGMWYKVCREEFYTGNDYGSEEVDYRQIIDAYPNTLGFDYSCQLPAGIQNNPYIFYEDGKWMPLEDDSEIIFHTEPWGNEGNRRARMKDSYWETHKAGPMLAQKAVDFIDRHLSTDPGRPFFMYYCSQAVHGPHSPPITFHGDSVKGRTLSAHGDMIYELDLQVGMIVKALKESGQYDNTLFIFTSDNGGLDVGATEATGHDSSNGFRERKGSIYEGGHIVPFIVSWPDSIQAGTLSEEPVMAHDLMATMYAITGQSMPEDQAMDSYNLLPLLTGKPGAKGRDLMMLQGAGSNSQVAIRKGNWKLIIQSYKDKEVFEEPIALFDLGANPYEDEAGNLIDVAGQQDRIQELTDLYNSIRKGRKRTTEQVQ
jgi:arylsulfatase A-like enzyme